MTYFGAVSLNFEPSMRPKGAALSQHSGQYRYVPGMPVTVVNQKAARFSSD